MWTEFVVLFLAACAAGVMNAIAGGGTIITFPALIAFGMPAIQANATSTFALLAGIIGSLYGYRSHFPAVSAWVGKFTPVSIVGGLIGAWLLTRTSEEFFDLLVPFLIFFATIVFVLHGVIRRLAGAEAVTIGKTGAGTVLALVLQFGVAVYGGYFGAGIGILMLASLGLLGLQNIHEMNAIKTVLSSVINVVAVAYFIYAGLVIWPQAVVMTVGATLGYFGGAQFAQRIPQAHVRILISVIGLGLSAIFFWRQFVAP